MEPSEQNTQNPGNHNGAQNIPPNNQQNNAQNNQPNGQANPVQMFTIRIPNLNIQNNAMNQNGQPPNFQQIRIPTRIINPNRQINVNANQPNNNAPNPIQLHPGPQGIPQMMGAAVQMPPGMMGGIPNIHVQHIHHNPANNPLIIPPAVMPVWIRSTQVSRLISNTIQRPNNANDQFSYTNLVETELNEVCCEKCYFRIVDKFSRFCSHCGNSLTQTRISVPPINFSFLSKFEVKSNVNNENSNNNNNTNANLNNLHNFNINIPNNHNHNNQNNANNNGNNNNIPPNVNMNPNNNINININLNVNNNNNVNDRPMKIHIVGTYQNNIYTKYLFLIRSQSIELVNLKGELIYSIECQPPPFHFFENPNNITKNSKNNNSFTNLYNNFIVIENSSITKYDILTGVKLQQTKLPRRSSIYYYNTKYIVVIFGGNTLEFSIFDINSLDPIGKISPFVSIVANFQIHDLFTGKYFYFSGNNQNNNHNHNIANLLNGNSVIHRTKLVSLLPNIELFNPDIETHISDNHNNIQIDNDNHNNENNEKSNLLNNNIEEFNLAIRFQSVRFVDTKDQTYLIGFTRSSIDCYSIPQLKEIWKYNIPGNENPPWSFPYSVDIKSKLLVIALDYKNIVVLSVETGKVIGCPFSISSLVDFPLDSSIHVTFIHIFGDTIAVLLQNSLIFLIKIGLLSSFHLYCILIYTNFI